MSTVTEVDEIENERIDLKAICDQPCWSCFFPVKELIDKLIADFSMYENDSGMLCTMYLSEK